MTRAWPVLLAAGLLAGVALAVARPLALVVSLAVWLLLSLPGLVFFGTRPGQGPAAVALASAVGVASSVMAVAVIGCLFGRYSLALVLGAVAALAIAARAARSRIGTPWPRDEDRAWTSASTVVVVLLALIALPYAFVGHASAGGFAYRPFFQADFFKHMGYTHSVLLGALPPEDAFAAGSTLHYYWLAYLIPATVVRASREVVTAQEAVLLTGLWQSAVLALLLSGVARRLCGRPVAAALAATLGFLALSPDGLAALVLRASGRVAAGVDLNPESVDLFNFVLPFRLDVNGLGRLCLYVQQHQLALIFFLGWALLATLAEERERGSRSVCKVLLLLPMLGTSLLVGAAATLVILASEAGLSGPRLRRSALFAAAAAAGAAWAAGIGMFEGAQAERLLSSAAAPLPVRVIHAFCLGPQLVTNCGGPGLLGAWGALLLFRRADLPVPARRMSAAGLAVASAAMLLGRLLPFPLVRFEVDLKTSYVLGVCCVLGASAVLARLRELWPRHRGFLASCGVLLALGLPSPVLDVLWHVDLEGASTTRVPAGDMEALRFIRTHLPREAVVQGYPYEHFVDRDVWVPIFGGRAVAAAPRGTSGGDERVRRAAALFDETDAAVVSRRATELGIDYLYVHGTMGVERAARLTHVLDGAPERFERAYANDEAAVWRLIPIRERLGAAAGRLSSSRPPPQVRRPRHRRVAAPALSTSPRAGAAVAVLRQCTTTPSDTRAIARRGHWSPLCLLPP